MSLWPEFVETARFRSTRPYFRVFYHVHRTVLLASVYRQGTNTTEFTEFTDASSDTLLA